MWDRWGATTCTLSLRLGGFLPRIRYRVLEPGRVERARHPERPDDESRRPLKAERPRLRIVAGEQGVDLLPVRGEVRRRFRDVDAGLAEKLVDGGIGEL